MSMDFTGQTKDLIDNLKGTCASYGLGNDGNESKIITQVFLYKFMNDKFGYELKKVDTKFANAENWEKILISLSDDEFSKITRKLPPNTARLKKDHLLSSLFNKQNSDNFAQYFDSVLLDIAQTNASLFSVSTAGNSKIQLFEPLTQFVSDPSKRDSFARALVTKLVNFSFEEIFEQKFDFFSTIFEYLIKDYNKDGGGKYAEYYTPHAVSKIMAKILVDKKASNVTVYDPSAGSGTLLMNVAHEIGESNCTIYSQDISQKSSGMLRLNLILNNLVHSIPNIIQGNTLLSPFFRENEKLKKFDFIVSNPPFKLDFSEFRDELDIPENSERFFAGLPKVPDKKKDSMPIYLLFLQHILSSLSPKGKAAIVVPTGFLTAQDKICLAIRKQIVDTGSVTGVVSMPSNIFATTGTNVSVLFIDFAQKKSNVLFVDASNLGTTYKEGKNQKTLLSEEEENYIISTFASHDVIKDFSSYPTIEEVREKAYSFNPGQYFEMRIEHESISAEEYSQRISTFRNTIENSLESSRVLQTQILEGLENLVIRQGKKKK